MPLGSRCRDLPKSLTRKCLIGGGGGVRTRLHPAPPGHSEWYSSLAGVLGLRWGPEPPEAKSWHPAALARVVKAGPSHLGPELLGPGWAKPQRATSCPGAAWGAGRHLRSKPLILCANTEVPNQVKETLQCTLSSYLDKYIPLMTWRAAF